MGESPSTQGSFTFSLFTMFDVFISHSSKDYDIAEAICDYLESSGLKCWIAPRNVSGGRLYSEEIIEGIKSSMVFLLLFSVSSNMSKHVLSELDVAFNNEKVILPFCLDDSSMSEALSYYLTATHRIVGFPDPGKRYEDLRASIVANIPELALERDKSQMFEAVASELGLSVDELMRIRTSFRSSDSSDGAETAGPKADAGEKGRSRYDVLVNDRHEILIVMNERNGVPDSPLFIIDPITRFSLLYRNSKSTVLFDDLAPKANIAIRAVSEMVVVETTDGDVIREYKVPVRVVKDVRALLDDNPDDFDDAHDLYASIELDENSENQNDEIEGYVTLVVDSNYQEVDAGSVLFYQEDGACILSTHSGFIVLRELTEDEVSILDRCGVAYVITPDTPPNNDEDLEQDGSLFSQWAKSAELKENAISVESRRVLSLLQYLSNKWNQPSIV